MLKPGGGFTNTPEGDPIRQRSGRTVGVSWEGARAAKDGAVYQILLTVTVPQRITFDVLFPGGAVMEEPQ